MNSPTSPLPPRLAMDRALDPWPAIVEALGRVIDSMPAAPKPYVRLHGAHGRYESRSAKVDEAL